MVRRALVFVLFACAVGGACTSFTAEPANPTSDAGAADTGIGDAGASDGAWRPCTARPQSPAHFCVDFDDPNVDVLASWRTRYVIDGGVFEPSTEALTPPRAVRIATPAGDVPAQAELVQKFDNVDVAHASHVAVNFDFMVLRPLAVLDGGIEYAQIAVLDFGPAECVTLASGQRQRAIEIMFRTNGGFGGALKGLEGCSIPNDYVPFESSFTTESFGDRFHHAQVDLAKTGCPNDSAMSSVTVAIDGTTIACKGVDIDAFAAAKPLTLLLGVFVGNPGVAHSDVAVLYDDVTVDVE